MEDVVPTKRLELSEPITFYEKPLFSFITDCLESLQEINKQLELRDLLSKFYTTFTNSSLSLVAKVSLCSEILKKIRDISPEIHEKIYLKNEKRLSVDCVLQAIKDINVAGLTKDKESVIAAITNFFDAIVRDVKGLDKSKGVLTIARLAYHDRRIMDFCQQLPVEFWDDKIPLIYRSSDSANESYHYKTPINCPFDFVMGFYAYIEYLGADKKPIKDKDSGKKEKLLRFAIDCGFLPAVRLAVSSQIKAIDEMIIAKLSQGKKDSTVPCDHSDLLLGILVYERNIVQYTDVAVAKRGDVGRILQARALYDLGLIYLGLNERKRAYDLFCKAKQVVESISMSDLYGVDYENEAHNAFWGKNIFIELNEFPRKMDVKIFSEDETKPPSDQVNRFLKIIVDAINYCSPTSMRSWFEKSDSFSGLAQYGRFFQLPRQEKQTPIPACSEHLTVEAKTPAFLS